MSKYGREWERHRQQREEEQKQLKKLLETVPGTPKQIEVLIGRLREFQARWDLQDIYLAAVPD